MTMGQDDVKIYEVKRIDVEGAIVIDGFPSVGLVSSIVANYLIDTLHMEQIGIVESPSFPTVSLVRDGTPQHPVRSTPAEPGRIAPAGWPTRSWRSFRSSTPRRTSSIPSRPRSSTGSRNNGAGSWSPPRVSSSSSPRSIESRGRGPRLADVKVYGVASTQKARELYIEPNMSPFMEGVITGIAGVLLNEGRRRGFDVLTFLAEAQADYPDARAAAKVIETINRILLHTPLDPIPLYHEAERIEQQLLSIQRKAADKVPGDRPTVMSQPMYR